MRAEQAAWLPLATPTAVLAIHGHLRDMPHTGRHRISVALRLCEHAPVAIVRGPLRHLPADRPANSSPSGLTIKVEKSRSLDPYLRSSFKRDFCGEVDRPFSALFATYRPSPPHPRHHGPGTLMFDYQKAVNPPFSVRAPILTAWRPVKNPRDWCVWRLVVSCAFLQSAAPTNFCQHSRTYVRIQRACKFWCVFAYFPPLAGCERGETWLKSMPWPPALASVRFTARFAVVQSFV